jgi:hypothetical protein
VIVNVLNAGTRTVAVLSLLDIVVISQLSLRLNTSECTRLSTNLGMFSDAQRRIVPLNYSSKVTREDTQMSTAMYRYSPYYVEVLLVVETTTAAGI